jgi:hypothetical protein
MSAARYVEGVLLLGLILAAVAFAAVVARRRLLPDWEGAPARLAEVVAGLGIVVLVSEALGVVGLFRLVPLVVAVVAVGLAAGWLERRSAAGVPGAAGAGAAPTATPMPFAPSRLQLVAAVAATAVVVAEWSVRTIDALRFGMIGIDTLWYHLPVAARFAQQGSIAHLHYLDSDPVTVFYPASSELLHAVGMVVMGSDVLSTVMNLGWLALALLAAWCLGRRFGVAPLTLIAAAVVLGTAELVEDEPGGGYNDIVVVALVLAALALLVAADRGGRWAPRRPELGVAALAAGLALGVKYTAAFPVAGMTVAILALSPSGERLRRTGTWLAGVVAGGGFWYLRNLVATGNPVPQVHLGVGSLRLPGPPNPPNNVSPAHNITDGAVWREIFLPGLHAAFGPASTPLLLLALLGAVAALVLPPPSRDGGADQGVRLVAFVGLVALAGYVVTPQPQPAAGVPALFVYNVRFLAPAVVIGLLLVPVAWRAGRGWKAAVVLAAFGAMLAASQWAHGIWAHGTFNSSSTNALLGPHSFGAGLATGAAVLAAGSLLVLRRGGRRAWRARATPVMAAAAVAGALGLGALGLLVQRTYLDQRYMKPGLGGVQVKTYAWARSVHHARIAIADLILQYPLYGKDLTNHVQVLGRRGPHGDFAPYRDCDGWRQAVAAGGYDYVVSADNLTLAGKPWTLATATHWTATDPRATLVQRELTVSLAGLQRISVFALHRARARGGGGGG